MPWRRRGRRGMADAGVRLHEAVRRSSGVRDSTAPGLTGNPFFRNEIGVVRLRDSILDAHGKNKSVRFRSPAVSRGGRYRYVGSCATRSWSATRSTDRHRPASARAPAAWVSRVVSAGPGRPQRRVDVTSCRSTCRRPMAASAWAVVSRSVFAMRISLFFKRMRFRSIR